MVNDDDLLKNAIPIEDVEDDDDAAAPDAGEEDDSIELSEATEGETGGESKIRSFDKAKEADERQWTRTPNATGDGAMRVKTFHCALRHEAVQHLDDRINEWLDANSGYEVKLVTTTVGELAVKVGTEPTLFVSVWV